MDTSHSSFTAWLPWWIESAFPILLFFGNLHFLIPEDVHEMSRTSRWLFVSALLASHLTFGWGSSASPGQADVVLATMQQEVQRAQQGLGKLDPAPYFLSYLVHDQSQAFVVGVQGAIVNSTHTHTRSADVVVRVGSPELDNSHEQGRASAISAALLPLDDDHDAIARELWRLTYEEYRKASQAYLNIK